jgi:hypothetical protein
MALLRSTDESNAFVASKSDRAACSIRPLISVAHCTASRQPPVLLLTPETRLYLTQAVIIPDGSISHLFGALATGRWAKHPNGML